VSRELEPSASSLIWIAAVYLEYLAAALQMALTLQTFTDGLNNRLAGQWIALCALINATAVALLFRFGALDWMLVCKVLCYHLFDAVGFLGDGGYRGSNPSGILTIYPVGVAHYLDDPVFAGDAQMKLGLDHFRLEPLVDVFDDCILDAGVSGRRTISFLWIGIGLRSRRRGSGQREGAKHKS